MSREIFMGNNQVKAECKPLKSAESWELRRVVIFEAVSYILTSKGLHVSPYPKDERDPYYVDLCL
jgi:hypothetical protein